MPKLPYFFYWKVSGDSHYTLVLQCWLLFCARMIAQQILLYLPVACALSTMMLCLLKWIKHRVIWSLLYWRRSTWLGKFHLKKFFQLFLKVCKQHRHAVLWCQTNDFVISELSEMQVIVCMPDTHTHTRLTRDAEAPKLHSGSGSGFFTGSSSGSGPAQQAKTNKICLRLSTRCFPGGTYTLYKLVTHGCRFSSRYRIVRKDQD